MLIKLKYYSVLSWKTSKGENEMKSKQRRETETDGGIKMGEALCQMTETWLIQYFPPLSFPLRSRWSNKDALSVHTTLQRLPKEVWKATQEGSRSGRCICVKSRWGIALWRRLMANDGVFRETIWLWICCNYCLVQSFPQSPDDQIRLEATLVLICKYHTLAGTRTTADGIWAGGEFSRKFTHLWKWKWEKEKPKSAKKEKRIRNKSALQTHKHTKSLCVILVSSCRLTQKECPEACRHAHRKMRGNAVVVKAMALCTTPCQRKPECLKVIDKKKR